MKDVVNNYVKLKDSRYKNFRLCLRRICNLRITNISACKDQTPVKNGDCKCGNSTCNSITAPFCDISLNDKTGGCKCSANEDACTTDLVDRCLNDKCVCGDTGSPCVEESQICQNSSCRKELLQI